MFPNFTHTTEAAETDSDFRAVWVSTVLNLDFPSTRGLSVDKMKSEIDYMISRASELGLNAIILQVRPSADSFYKSDIFPWSIYLTGVQGVAPDGGFDPLAYWIDQAHGKGLELHAWINPYRVTHTSLKTTDVNALAASNPARKNPTWAKIYNGALYFDPGLPECKQLIVDGVAEILKKYDVDGIHLDDYFYPGADFPDNDTYAKYGNGMNRDDWRRENVNDVIKKLRDTVKEIKPTARFGVAPSGIWQNKSSSTLGSDTRGFESYKSIYADTRKWVKEGWLDYICPQIYWYIGYDIADYQKLLFWWQDVCKGTEVDLYIGHAAYKEDTNEDKWKGEIIRQLKLNAASDVVKGSVFFRITHLKGNLGEQIKSFYSSGQNTAIAAPTAPVTTTQQYIPSITMDKLTVAQPSGNVSVTAAAGYNILGTCVPGIALYMNGELVTNRTPEGFFSVYAALATGQNVFTFTQDGQNAITRTITARETPAVVPETMKQPAILNASPSSDIYLSKGDTVTLRCTAPAGAQVFANFYGETVELTSDNPNRSNSLNSTQILSSTYSFVYTLNDSGDETAIINLGAPLYSMNYQGKTYKSAAAGSIQLIGATIPFYATVTSDMAWVYQQSSSGNGASWHLVKGQKDKITAITGGGSWVRLASGKWIERQNVSCVVEDVYINNVLSDGVYQQGVDIDVIKWKASAYPALNVRYDGSSLYVYLGLHTEHPSLDTFLWENGVEIITQNIGRFDDNGTPFYKIEFKDGAKIEGFYVDYSNGELRLNIKKRRTLTAGDKPLAGFTFVVDAGHGLSDPGAKGPMGTALTEKDINLKNANKLSDRLERLGAAVVRVRSTDLYYTLQERTEINRAVKPDMFISMHANSMGETTNATNIRGLTVWYMNPNSLNLADTLISRLFSVNPLTTRQSVSYQSNFYVCRPVWTPSVIIEASFMCNIEDFAWLINDEKQNELADGIVDAILGYYRAN